MRDRRGYVRAFKLRGLTSIFALSSRRCVCRAERSAPTPTCKRLMSIRVTRSSNVCLANLVRVRISADLTGPTTSDYCYETAGRCCCLPSLPVQSWHRPWKLASRGRRARGRRCRLLRSWRWRAGRPPKLDAVARLVTAPHVESASDGHRSRPLFPSFFALAIIAAIRSSVEHAA